ncbi:MAG: 2-oxo acid dehydrogenase subunit E2 [Chloroflexi bacterium]|nr:MAG: 2-oxo acid dehydrogenase subunit E2 [Chloroflexota bacterium]
MPQEIRMPALGQTTDELTILRWFKQVGDTITRGDLLLEVETDKATLEVEAAVSGELIEIVFEAGEVVASGTTIAYVADASNDAKPDVNPAEFAASQSVEQAVSLSQPDETMLETPEPSSTSAAYAQFVESQNVVASAMPAARSKSRVLARPTARHLARQHNIDLREVKGTGSGGLIEKRDVQAFIDKQLQKTAHSLRNAPAHKAVQSSEPVDTPVPPHRLKIAQQMTHSAQNIPQITLSVAIDMRCAQSFVEAQRSAGNTGLKMTHLLLLAISTALQQHPQVNTLWLDDGPRLRHLPHAHVGLAVAKDDQLLVVSIPEPARLALEELVTLTDAAVDRARRAKLSVTDLQPAAVTLSNLGMYHIDDFVALVEPGKTGIVAAGHIIDTAIPKDGGIHIIPQMRVRFSVDHRLVDGVLAAQFLTTLRETLETMVCAQ